MRKECLAQPLVADERGTEKCPFRRVSTLQMPWVSENVQFLHLQTGVHPAEREILSCPGQEGEGNTTKFTGVILALGVRRPWFCLHCEEAALNT
jgi:hypothetical protein